MAVALAPFMNPLAAGQHALTDAMRMSDMGMQIATENYVNARSTGATADEDPYTRKQITFKAQMDRKRGINTVSIDNISPDDTPYSEEYMPNHPAADDRGMVKFPNVKPEFEMVDFQTHAIAKKAAMQMYRALTEMTHRTHSLLDSVRG